MKHLSLVALAAGALLLAGGLAPAPAFAVADATIHGTITMPDGSVPDGTPDFNICSSLTSCGVAASTQFNGTTGAYSVIVPGGQSYRFGVVYQGSVADIVPETYWGGGNSLADAPVQFVAGGADLQVDLQFLKGATIAGQVTGADATLPAANITATTTGGTPFTGVFNPATQQYLIDSLPPGSYSVAFTAGPRYADQWWNASATASGSTAVTVTAAQNVSGIDATLARTGSVSGVVDSDDGTGPVPHQGDVTLSSVSGSVADMTVISDVSGAYEFDGVPAGDYRLCAAGDQFAIPGCWGGGDSNSAPTITIADGQVITGDDISLQVGGELMATVKLQHQLDPPVAQMNNGQVDMWRLNDAGTQYDLVASANVKNGAFDAQQLPPGSYRVEFRDLSGQYSSVWWNAVRYFSQASDIVIAGNQQNDLGTVTLHDRFFDTNRTFDQDRFSGAVKMTQVIWPLATETPGSGGVPLAGVPVIYIANGLNYPDALSAGPAAIRQQGALLLVLPTAIPSSVATELARLRPQKIVIVGGPASVSPAVQTQLGQYSSNVTRQSGNDRFEASRNLANAVWGAPASSGAPKVFIATGNNFPDALDAGPAAGLIDAPVILVNGLLPTLDPATAQLLTDLGTTDVYIAGGPASVTPGIETALSTLLHGARHVHRFTGSTRYEAAAAINEWFFPTTETAFLATGANFPDALAGAPLAGAVGGPIYLSQPGCIPQIVAQQLVDGDTQLIWLLGGPASLTPDVESLLVCGS